MALLSRPVISLCVRVLGLAIVPASCVTGKSREDMNSKAILGTLKLNVVPI
jgi:hypothetical protein